MTALDTSAVSLARRSARAPVCFTRSLGAWLALDVLIYLFSATSALAQSPATGGASVRQLSPAAAVSIQQYLPELNRLQAAADWNGLESQARAALQALQTGVGVNPSDIAAAAGWLAISLQGQARYGEAEPLYRRALAIQEKTLGPEQPEVAADLNDLAALLWAEGRYGEAEPLYRRVLTILDKSLGSEHPFMAFGLNNLAELLTAEGRYGEAEPLFRRALAIREKALGPEHPDVATILNNIGELLGTQGRYGEAETLDLRALAIDEKTLGPEHPAVAMTLNNLALHLQYQGRYGEAEPLYRRALAIWEKALGPGHPHVATSLNNIGELLGTQGRYGEAEPLDRRALAIDEKALGPEHPAVALNLNNLAELLRTQGRYGEAEPLDRRALAIREKALGPEHPDVAMSLNNLAALSSAQGRYGEAEHFVRRAQAIYEKALGPESPEAVHSRENLAVAEALQGEFDQAVASFRVACATLARKTVPVNASSASRIAIQGLSIACSSQFATALWGWSGQGGGPAPADRPAALRAEAFRAAQSGFIASADAALAQASARSLANKFGAGAEAEAYETALIALDNLNDQFAKAAGTVGAEEKQKNLAAQRDALQVKIKALEETLKTKAPAYWDYRSPQPLDVAALQATSGDDAKMLRANEAVVMSLSGSGEDKRLVFAISKTGFAWAQIGLTGDELAAKVAALRGQIDPQADTRGLIANHPQSSASSGFDRKTAHELYVALLGDPKIQAVINGVGIDTLIFASTGPLTSLPPSLLVVDPPTGADGDPQSMARTHWLIRDKALAVLPAVASLKTLRVLLPASRKAADLKLLALADPDFKGTGEIPHAEDGAPPTRSVAPQARSVERDGRGSEALADLPPLYSTLAEGRALAALLAPGETDALLAGPDASKTRLLAHDADHSLARVQVLSFSTHGLLTGDFSGLTEPALALAHPPKVGADPSDDGLLKASQAAALTLNADWVVLSACNTASGDGQGAEGLSGLARAFFHAGATTLLVSHWRVDDAATARLIAETFRLYKGGRANLASNAQGAARPTPRMTKAQALRLAILEMIDEPDGRRTDPRFWAPFVVVGEPQ